MQAHPLPTEIRYKGVVAMARRLKVSHAFLSMILHGKRKPKAKLKKQLAEMGVNVGE